jgi:threonine dehydratase
MSLSLGRIEEARRYLAGRIRRTPLEESPVLSGRLGAPVWLKLENLQLTGSFKVRAALWRLSLLTPEERVRGVATCSAGNHGKGIAFAARELGVAATVYLPRSVDPSKRGAIAAMGAEAIVSRFDGYDDTEEWALSEIARTGKVFISSFDHDETMAANGGTLALEVLEDVPQARAFLLPVGGGGLSGGFAYAVKERLPEGVIVGCQLEASPALKLSLATGRAVTRLPAVETAAGGLEGGIGAKTFEVLRSRVDRVALMTEEEVLEGVRWMAENHQYLIEPSSAVTIAACLTGKAGAFDQPAVVVLSGRNMSATLLSRILRG